MICPVNLSKCHAQFVHQTNQNTHLSCSVSQSNSHTICPANQSKCPHALFPEPSNIDTIVFTIRFRRGFKYAFRWLPCVKMHPSDAMSRPANITARMSMSDTKAGYERNGSMMHTMIETMDCEQSPTTPLAYNAINRGSKQGFRPIQEDEDMF